MQNKYTLKQKTDNNFKSGNSGQQDDSFIPSNHRQSPTQHDHYQRSSGRKEESSIPDAVRTDSDRSSEINTQISDAMKKNDDQTADLLERAGASDSAFKSNASDTPGIISTHSDNQNWMSQSGRRPDGEDTTFSQIRSDSTNKMNRSSVRNNAPTSINKEGTASPIKTPGNTQKPGIIQSRELVPELAGIIRKNGSSAEASSADEANRTQAIRALDDKNIYNKLTGRKESELGSIRGNSKELKKKKDVLNSGKEKKQEKSSTLKKGSGFEQLVSSKKKAAESAAAASQPVNIPITQRIGKVFGSIADSIKSIASKSSAMAPIALAMTLGVSVMGGGSFGAVIEGGGDSGKYETDNDFITIENCPNAYETYNQLIKQGFSEVTACAILGNAFQETGGGGSCDINPAANADHGGWSDVGIWQWTDNSSGKGKTAYLNWAQSNGYSYDSIEAQCKYLKLTLTESNHWYAAQTGTVKALMGGGNLAKIYSSAEFYELTDLKEATAAFLGEYEDPVYSVYTPDGSPCNSREETAAAELRVRLNCAAACYNRFAGGGALRFKDLNKLSGLDYVQWAIAIGEDDTHGYTFGAGHSGYEEIDYDCSSLVSYALINTGWPLSEVFCTTDGTEVSALKGMGFTELPANDVSQLQVGDIMWRSGHTEIYMGDGMTIGAHSNYDGVQGDSSGKEICPVEIGTWTSAFRPPASLAKGHSGSANGSYPSHVDPADILAAAKNRADFIRANGFQYGHATKNPAIDCSERKVSCDRFVCMTLYFAGFRDQVDAEGYKTITAPYLKDYLQSHGFKKIQAISDLKAGDIVFVRNGEHVFVLGNSRGNGLWERYDAGAQWRIESQQPFVEGIGSFQCAYRAP